MGEGGGVSAQSLQAFVEGVAGFFDQAVGVQQESGSVRQQRGGVDTGFLGSGAQKNPVTVGEVVGQAVMADQQRRRVTGIGPGQFPLTVVSLFDPGEDHGGHGDVGDVQHRFVEALDDLAGGSCRAQA